MYKMIIATYGLSLAIFLLAIDGYEYVIISGHYIFFLLLGAAERKRLKDNDMRQASEGQWEFGTSVEKKEKRSFASMSH
ncbi:MAG TPA: hypothetical protein VGF14_05945 [Alphaproteobacteria bacterium]